MRYLITIRVDPDDPRHTQDVAIEARSAYQARWVYLKLNPSAKLAAIRPAPEHRQ